MCGKFQTPCKWGESKSPKLAVFEEKQAYKKQIWQPNVQTFFRLVFGSDWTKSQINFCKITILSSHALREKIF